MQTVQDPVPQKKVRRSKRPVFTEKDSSGIYFGNVFNEAIQGERPLVTADLPPSTSPIGVPGDDSSSNLEGFAWSSHISGDVLEAEIKRLQKDLMRQVTSPGKYKTEYTKARYSFQMLSMLFGIIIEHDEDVRWKRVANLAQPTFSIAAKNARRGDSDSYQYAVARRDDLAELIRGGNMSSNEKPVDALVWGDVVSRSPLMERLQESVDKVKPMLSSKDEFSANREAILHEANLLAAMSEILGRDSMEDAEEDDYVAYTREMGNGARMMISSLTADSYDAVSEGFNQINQSCSNCHDDWR